MAGPTITGIQFHVVLVVEWHFVIIIVTGFKDDEIFHLKRIVMSNKRQCGQLFIAQSTHFFPVTEFTMGFVVPLVVAVHALLVIGCFQAGFNFPHQTFGQVTLRT